MANEIFFDRSRRFPTVVRSARSSPGYIISIIASDEGHLADICAEMGSFMHACEGEMLCESINPKIPYFNAPIYLENKVRLSNLLSMADPV